jgi:hypothetical protein
MQHVAVPTTGKEATELQGQEQRPILEEYKGADVSEDSLMKGWPEAYRPKKSVRDYTTILRIFRENFVEVRFVRRTTSDVGSHRRPARSLSRQMRGQTRRMLCTSNWALLRKAKRYFGFREPRGPRRGKSYYKFKKLLITYDLMARDFRVISLDEWEILGLLPFNDPKKVGPFLAFYQATLPKLTGMNEQSFYNG